MKVEFTHTQKMGASKYGPYYGIDDVITIYKEGLIDRDEARFMLGCITKHSYLMSPPIPLVVPK